MLNYTEMYAASVRPLVVTVASFNERLTGLQLSMINQWGKAQRDMLRRFTIPLVNANPATVSQAQASAASTSSGSDEAIGADGEGDDVVQPDDGVAVHDDHAAGPDDAIAEVDESAASGALQPEQADGGDRPHHEQAQVAPVSAVDEPVAVNAAMAILANPALAAEAATRRSDEVSDEVGDEVIDEVRDDVADDIAAEIDREVKQEFEQPRT